MHVQIELPAKVIYSNAKRGDMSLHKHVVTVGNVYKKGTTKIDTSDLIGEYVVIGTALDGGGYGHGPGDYYPDGWEVTARKLDFDGKYSSEGTEIFFMQSGCFTHTNDMAIPVMRTMKKVLYYE